MYKVILEVFAARFDHAPHAKNTSHVHYEHEEERKRERHIGNNRWDGYKENKRERGTEGGEGGRNG